MINLAFVLNRIEKTNTEVEKMRKNTKFLCCLTTFAALIVVCLGDAGLDDEAQGMTICVVVT